MKKEENEETQSLLDVFKVGDRVKQIYYDTNGKELECIGVVIDIKEHCMAIQWDTINGKPDSDNYSICHIYEIFNGDEGCSPIIKENN